MKNRDVARTRKMRSVYLLFNGRNSRSEATSETIFCWENGINMGLRKIDMVQCRDFVNT